jgi:SAM-dependent methyltransferase
MRVKVWHRNVIRNTIMAAVPGRRAMRKLLRKVRPYRTDPVVDTSLLEGALRLIEILRQSGTDIAGRRVLEIGSGWHPIVPVVFIAAGARSVALTDLDRLLDARLLRSAITYVLDRCEAIAARIGTLDTDRISIPDGDLDVMLAALDMTYTVPWRTAMSPAASLDLIVSRAVLEHIPPGTLDGMHADCRRILVPGGVMIHLIDVSDHRAMRDKSLSRCAFLEYEDFAWRMLCLNPQSYHNRLRHSDHVGLIRRNGFKIIHEWRHSREKEQEEVRAMRLASRFRGRELEDLAAISTHVVAQNP